MKAETQMDNHRSSDQKTPTPTTQNPSADDAPRNGNGRNGILARLRNFFSGRGERDEEIMELVGARDETDNTPLSPEEKSLIAASVEFSTRTAEAVSVPRADMITVPTNADFKSVIDTFADCQHSRLPVVGEDLDDVVGFITLKDLVKFIGREAAFNLRENLRPCTFVPDNLSVFKVLEAMRRDRVQMAIVVDEYGGTAGLVALKDIIEVLVGEMEDEHETSSPQMLTPVGDNAYRVDPRLPIEILEEELGSSFILTDNQGNEMARDFETAGGLVLALARKMPAQDEEFTTGNGYTFTVKQTDGRRIQMLELSYNPMAAQTDEYGERSGMAGA